MVLAILLYFMISLFKWFTLHVLSIKWPNMSQLKASYTTRNEVLFDKNRYSYSNCCHYD